LTRYSILSRDFSKIHQLNENVFLLSSGMVADVQALRGKLDEIIDGYEYKMFRRPHLHPTASMLCSQFLTKAKTLYSKRFFPYYTFNLLAGITPDGEPRVYGYDAIGSYDTQPYAVQGSGQQLMVGLLDNQFQRRCF
jgi:20S proteasome subunit beta 6